MNATTPPMRDTPITDATAWRGAELAPEQWCVPLGEAALAELDAVARAHAGHAGSVEGLAHDPADWPATMAAIEAIRARVERGVGFAVLDRLPVERWSEQAARAVAWLLCNAIAPAVNQKWTGTRIYEVRDTGAQLGYGVRRSLTNLKQDIHTDGPWLPATAQVMGLACLRQADSGGLSRVVSLATVHNQLLATRPELLARLYRPFPWDRQAEHAPGDAPVRWLPVFAWDGARLNARYYDDYIHNGCLLTKQALDPEGSAALDALRALAEDPRNAFEFRLRPGQLYVLDNRLLAHGRSAFADSAADPGRLLLRFWLRRHGGTAMEAADAA